MLPSKTAERDFVLGWFCILCAPLFAARFHRLIPHPVLDEGAQGRTKDLPAARGLVPMLTKIDRQSGGTREDVVLRHRILTVVIDARGGWPQSGQQRRARRIA